jgi:hypothetical protein
MQAPIEVSRRAVGEVFLLDILSHRMSVMRMLRQQPMKTSRSKVFQKAQGGPNCGFFIPFADPREVGHAFPSIVTFGIGLGTPRRFRVRVAVQNFDAVSGFTNHKFQRSTKLTLCIDPLEIGKYL